MLTASDGVNMDAPVLATRIRPLPSNGFGGSYESPSKSVTNFFSRVDVCENRMKRSAS